ncbi:right-handed parallel beta-helix repeat-containing protein [Geminisphaera colitermitum]|uniref:right-handed parallel beta-helix repeat-containing protein n=1 Tax=Geminisphaera colitermitum TaxID=1148786 RepID=UPI000158CBE5|nr:right-handed parallel beta-helix repeat-containing protein [Geminisphaera colitermitum]
MRHPFPALFLLALSLGLPGLSAEFLHVAPAPVGKADAPGTEEAPLNSVQAALDRAKAGDTVRLRKGVYRERVVFKNSGRHGVPVTLEGEPGAVLDGSHAVTLDWQPAPDIAPGVYRAALALKTRHVVADGRSVTMLRDNWVQPGRARRGEAWEYPKLFRDGVGVSGWEVVGGLALYRFKEKELFIRFRGDRDPRRMDITVGPPPEHPIILIDGVDRCVVRGLTLRNASGGVRIVHSLGSVVEGCVIGPVEDGIVLGSGADRATLRFNEIFWNPLGENRPKAPNSIDHWTANKRGGWGDKRGINLIRSAGGHRIHDNHIHHHWDGISVADGDRRFDRGLRIHHNRIEILVDDGLETQGGQEDCHWHDNFIQGTLCAIRLKAPDYGPLYIYRNILWDNREDIRNFGVKGWKHIFNAETGKWEQTHSGHGSPEALPARVYVYHNTGTAPAAITSNGVTDIGLPNYHYFNNLFWAMRWHRASDSVAVNPNWQGDYNVYVRRGDMPAWDTSEADAHSFGIDLHSLFTTGDPGFRDAAAGDFSLREDSLACGRGTDLRTRFGQPLPGCEPGDFKGGQPDVGALACGQPMPRIPRSKDSLREAPAGFWPDP